MASKHVPKPSWTGGPPLSSQAPPYAQFSPSPSSPESRSSSPPPFLLPLRLPFTRSYLRKRRTPLPAVLAGLTILTLSVLLFLVMSRRCEPVQVVQQVGVRQGVDDRFATRNWVRGPPKPRFADNLKPDVKYISTFVSSGWTANDVMTYGNLLYLSLLTQRVPVLGPFVPSHLSSTAGYIPFSDVFDIAHLAKSMNAPVLEWGDLKSVEEGVEEELGCWSAWMATSREIKDPRWSWIPGVFGLDISYTPLPYDHKMFPEQDNEPHLKYGKLMQLSFPSERARALSLSSPRGTKSGNPLLPSDHLLCFDQMYAISLEQQWEWFVDSSPVWRFVGRHMRWNKNAEALAKNYLAKHWGVPQGGLLPPYISVHARRGDFTAHCQWMHQTGSSCLPSLTQLQRRVSEVSEKLALKGVHTDRVLVTSDEKDETWWAGVGQLGYTWVDHKALRTDELYGEWYSPLLDAIFHSLAAGFVGTDQSTMSLLAARRVEEWNDGPVGFLLWQGVPEGEL
ncbi:hypothetical protein DACRYDRAFT_101597 [Dacryopinax primogenitus]|uniref:GDP-fucose protein O-fucosyltransferase 2 n=1 Tax=Dacryopinax primogenitus (strain DJM 731) TaxID=1858805 RepID=M5FU38_DACPD|nr:uncharacterized protein DACRYDRAFT_101597 [Dacryopinax primogenitus]EJT99009.1 hypothetical protein DACRYDRAFT_101597 [Dacryopinax primogenitus]